MDKIAQGARRKPNKRAGQVCQRCHEKKIKCDLNLRTEISRRCANCINTDSTCNLRPSRRGRKGRVMRQTQLQDETELLESRQSAPYTSSMEAPLEHNTAQISPLLSQPSLLDSQQHTDVSPLTVQMDGQRHTSYDNPKQRTYIGNTGYMEIFGSESTPVRHTTLDIMPVDCNSTLNAIPDSLLDSYIETYLEFAYVWCPVLDRHILQNPQVFGSPLLQNALALCGTRLRPPLIAHAQPSDHYIRAKNIIYGGQETNPLVQIIAIMLFYWWSPGPPNVASLDTGRWWVSTAIHLAEEIGLHQELCPVETYVGESSGLRRRIWWTLFARDRIVAMAQGRPCFIDPDYCNVPMVTLEDFPDPQDSRALIFIHWVKMWEIVGRIHKKMYQSKGVLLHKPTMLQDLIDWIHSLPASLQLPFNTNRTIGFNRDVYDLHLGYLTIVILLHMEKNERSIPTASSPAIIAASCIARIFKDYLARGSVRFLLTQTTWSIAVAMLALLHARRMGGLALYIDDEIRTLHSALTQLAPFSYPGKMFSQGIQKLLDKENASMSFEPLHPGPHGGGMEHHNSSSVVHEIYPDHGLEWMDLFPYLSTHTSPLIGALLSSGDSEFPPCDQELAPDILLVLQDLLSEHQGFYPGIL
ncbi:hypothetical protein BGW36DRAFT_75809 [Talaromyces proteolyticus]|uniref:Zn(2)-C6 fungal-type domain-containing protein n=1 Tax=Talaromyces proteolyticus TaxID=1131652 RepID=A0AAD4PSH7_9EURO|nr:uncharacterized protein BGW36DRAFT_75809 [Talaromyces proteolyticus]KAH8688966.1 hypothetical protein BGW36DRAFT_75809 [Talaromyces proteolyticus]